MAKNFDSSKLLIGIKKDIKKEERTTFNNVDSIVKKIHDSSADEKENIIENKPTKRTTLDIPKDLYKQIRMRVADKDVTIKDYILGLVKKDLELQ